MTSANPNNSETLIAKAGISKNKTHAIIDII
ncbi:hypothetical protein HmCmsJML068_00311 [Escherichia coli]|nr:hypothetical protein HmCmsJML068_00311 [Escherichia coli]